MNSSRDLGAAGVVVGVAVALWAGATMGGVRVSYWLTPRPEVAVNKAVMARAAGPIIPTSTAHLGREVWERACTQCHDRSGLGKPGLGKDLVRSEFVTGMTDEALAAFVAKGRPADDPLNTTKVPMPPDGGIELKPEERAAVVAWVRALQDPRRMPELPAYVAPVVVVSDEQKAAALSAAGGDAELAKYIANGDKLFHSVCVACHGKGGVGVKGNGKALAANEFVKSLDDDGLLAFISSGRAPTDPKNTTGIQMPPKGGNPALSEDDLLDIIAYLRTLQGAAVAGGASK